MRVRFLLVSTWLGAASGCADQAERPEMLTLDRVPAQVKEAAAKALPQVKFDSARKATIDGKEAYEVRGKEKGGKIREVEVTPDGKVLAVE
jgi:hypothetical protein